MKTFYYSLRSSLLDVCPVIQTINLGNNGITNSSVNIMQKWILRTNGSLSFTFDRRWFLCSHDQTIRLTEWALRS